MGQTKKITDRRTIDEIINQATFCHLAMSKDNAPYVVPMCFGYDGEFIYLHGSGQGMKIDYLKDNDQVCLEFDVDCKIQEADNPCKWDVSYKSVIVFGKASFVTDLEVKQKALASITNHYSNKSFEFPAAAVKAVTVVKIEIESVSAKES